MWFDHSFGNKVHVNVKIRKTGKSTFDSLKIVLNKK